MPDSSARPYPAARGLLAKTPLAHLLIYAWERRLTGSLHLMSGTEEAGAIVLIEGHTSKVRTREPVAYLGRVLLDLGYIHDALLNDSLVRLAKERRLHGQILLEAGHISDEQLREGLRVQLLRKLSHMFTLPPETTFTYYEGFDLLHDYGGDDEFHADPLPIIWRAICQAPPWDHVQLTLGRLGSRAVRITQRATPERFGFRPDELELVLMLANRPMAVRELAASNRLGARTTELLVFCLLITKQLDVVDVLGHAGPPSMLPPPLDVPSSGTPDNLTFDVPYTAGPVIAASAPPARVALPPAAPLPAARQPATSSPTQRPIASAAPVPHAPDPMIEPEVNRAPDASSLRRSTRPPNLTGTVAPVFPEHAERRKQIIERAQRIDKENYFEMLGVPRTATATHLQEAYIKLAKEWHPDRLHAPLADVKDHCAKVFARLSEAHATLTDTKKRGQYMKLLAEGGATPESQANIQIIIEAAQNFQKADACLKRSDFAQAEVLVKRALAADPGQADYIALAAWLESMRAETPQATLECIAQLDRAVVKNPNCERALFYRGLLHKKMQDHTNAARDFRKAVELNPRNIDAAREVRLYAMRRGKSSAPPPAANRSGQPPRTSGQPPRTSGRPGQRSAMAPKAPEESKGLFGKLFKK
jgi:tetratricopeptide (TPR) repeat protein